MSNLDRGRPVIDLSPQRRDRAVEGFTDRQGLIEGDGLLLDRAQSAADRGAARDARRDPEGDQPTPPALPPFNEVIFRATHNSYSGEERGAILEQLRAGVRSLEFDIHDNDYQRFDDYRLGHYRPDGEVERGGENPSDALLRSWLAIVDRWSRAHPAHAPLTLYIDLKDNLMDNRSFGAGNLAALNQRFTEVFGERLLWASEIGDQWPSADELRGRILIVLSGDSDTRRGYRWDLGANPAVAMNDAGQIVEVHDSGSGALWYWTGQLELDGSVRWIRHGRYDTGTDPAVAINNEGWIVEVHRSERRDTLWSTVGRLEADGEIAWRESAQYDNGRFPSLRFERLDSMRLQEIHQSQSNERRWTWTGALSAQGELRWSGNARTEAARFDETEAIIRGRMISVYLGRDGASPPTTLLFDTHRFAGQRIRYPQIAFVEVQPGDPDSLDQDQLWFYAARARERGWVITRRQRGKLVRQWGFNSLDDATTPASNFPSTDHPFERWYQSYCAMQAAAE